MRSTPLFVAAVMLCLLSAFAGPGRLAAVRNPFQNLYWPVARPTRAVAAAVDRRLHPDAVADDGSPGAPRPAEAVYAENRQLRAQLAALTVKFEQLSRLNADRQLVGDIRPLCQPATVAAGDGSGFRDTVQVTGVDDTAAGRPVVHGTDLVGRVAAAGLTGAAVQLVTDPGLALQVHLVRYVTDAGGGVRLERVGTIRPLVRGTGNGHMVVRNAVTGQDAADLHLAAGDLAVLDDTAWPANVQGFVVGRVTSVGPQPSAPLMAELHLDPVLDLRQLREVMVVVKDH